MLGFLKQLFLFNGQKRLKNWLYKKYEPTINYWNESESSAWFSHLLVDLGQVYMSIHYCEKIKKKFGVSEEEFERISKEVYDDLFMSCSNSEELNHPLHIR